MSEYILSHVGSLMLAFGIATSVFVSACGAAMKFVADKVAEEKKKLLKSEETQKCS